jgi:hypothetical protein
MAARSAGKPRGFGFARVGPRDFGCPSASCPEFFWRPVARARSGLGKERKRGTGVIKMAWSMIFFVMCDLI